MRVGKSLGLIACLGLAACATPRDADVRLPAAFEAPQPGGAEAAVLEHWWTAFDDPELTRLIEQALSDSPDARTAAMRLKEAQATRTSALMRFLPQGSLTGTARETHTDQLSGTTVNIPGFATSGETTSYAANFNVSWELDLFGRIFAAARAANGDVAAVRFAYEGTRASLAAAVADAYFQVRGQAIQLADARETARIQGDLARIVGERVKRGLSASADADRIAGDLAQAESQVAALEAELQASRRQLLILTGHGAEPTSTVPATASVGAPPAPPATIPSDLLQRRPDVREAWARVNAAAGRQTVANLAFFPTFTLTPGLGWSKTEQPGFNSTSESWSIGAGVTQPILDIPRLLFDLKAQNARTEQAVLAYEKAVQTAFGEAENAMVRLDADRRRVALLTEGAMRGERAFRASRLRYDAGIDDLQTLLVAEQAWRAVRSQLTAAQVQAMRRTVQTYKALGGGWPAQTYAKSR